MRATRHEKVRTCRSELDDPDVSQDRAAVGAAKDEEPAVGKGRRVVASFGARQLAVDVLDRPALTACW